MIGSSPSYYEEVPANEALREVSESAAKAEAGAVDILPFQALGGRRFEILTYLMLLDPPPPVGVLAQCRITTGADVVPENLKVSKSRGSADLPILNDTRSSLRVCASQPCAFALL
jgi:hypothetical protein